MTRNTGISRLAGLKALAKQIRTELAGNGTDISHSKALEMVAQRHGARDWNTLRAQVSDEPKALNVGDRVSGTYLGQPFTGRVHGLSNRGQNGAMQRVTLHFDEAVDVVKFDSFSSMRQRVSSTIRPDGRSVYKTSDGQPHLVVDAVA